MSITKAAIKPIADETFVRAVSAGASQQAAVYAQDIAARFEPELYGSAALAHDYFKAWTAVHDALHPVMVIHHASKVEPEIARRIEAMQLGRSSVTAIMVDTDPLQIEVDRIKRLLARYVDHVVGYEGEDFIGLGNVLTDDECAEIRAIVAEVTL
jgi:hypothetical protein